jgi:hypothetical protein
MVFSSRRADARSPGRAFRKEARGRVRCSSLAQVSAQPPSRLFALDFSPWELIDSLIGTRQRFVPSNTFLLQTILTV